MLTSEVIQEYQITSSLSVTLVVKPDKVRFALMPLRWTVSPSKTCICSLTTRWFSAGLWTLNLFKPRSERCSLANSTGWGVMGYDGPLSSIVTTQSVRHYAVWALQRTSKNAATTGQSTPCPLPPSSLRTFRWLWTLDIWRSKFVRKEGRYLFNETICTDPEKASAIKHFSRSKKIKCLRRFFGMCEWYQLFKPNYALLTVPLADMRRKKCQFC